MVFENVLHLAWFEPVRLDATPEVEWDVETDLDTVTEEVIEPPYKVFIHNDDVTPMDFVTTILQRIFELNPLHSLKCFK